MSFTIESEKQNRVPFLDVQIFVKIKHLPILSTVKQPLVQFMHILTAFHYLLLSLVLFTQSLIEATEYAQVGLNYTLNYILSK